MLRNVTYRYQTKIVLSLLFTLNILLTQTFSVTCMVYVKVHYNFKAEI